MTLTDLAVAVAMSETIAHHGETTSTNNNPLRSPD